MELSIEAAYRGIEGAAVSVTTAKDETACGYTFRVGERYLVYAYRSTDGRSLVVTRCSRTQRLDRAVDDLEFFQTLGGFSDGGRVFGTITRRELWSSGSDALRDVLMRVRGAAGDFSVRTDEEGRYEVTGLAPGRYELTMFPPAGYSPGYGHRTFTLNDARACYVADFSVHSDGRILGSVRTFDRSPAEGVDVAVLPDEPVAASSRKYVWPPEVTTDRNGDFEVRDVPPGKYVVALGISVWPKQKAMYPTTFYPGTIDRMHAGVIVLDRGEHRSLQPIVLPPARRAYELSGTVRYKDGQPAAGAAVSLGDEAERPIAHDVKADSEGRFSFVVHEGFSYVATAQVPVPSPGNGMYLSRVGPFLVSGGAPSITIVVPSR